MIKSKREDPTHHENIISIFGHFPDSFKLTLIVGTVCTRALKSFTINPA